MGVIMAKTKIVIIQLKEIIYTAIFVGLGIILILFLVFMFLPKDKDTKPTSQIGKYIPGVYTEELVLGDTTLNIEVVVDADHINSVSVANLSESISTMYPLVSPAIKELETQLINNISIDEIKISENSKYTQLLLLETIDKALKKSTR